MEPETDLPQACGRIKSWCAGRADPRHRRAPDALAGGSVASGLDRIDRITLSDVRADAFRDPVGSVLSGIAGEVIILGSRLHLPVTSALP